MAQIVSPALYVRTCARAAIAARSSALNPLNRLHFSRRRRPTVLLLASHTPQRRARQVRRLSCKRAAQLASILRLARN
jgi:hypothetical protein